VSRREDRGSATVELVVLVPVCLLLLATVVAFGRFADARADVDSMAREAARAASIAANPSAAVRRAQETTDSLQGATPECADVRQTADVSDFVPGGEVVITVSCRVALADLPFMGSVTRTITSEFREPIDRFRSRS
jgi:Flp pilus assembly protein TadG